jgi:hypothetical protein
MMMAIAFRRTYQCGWLYAWRVSGDRLRQSRQHENEIHLGI